MVANDVNVANGPSEQAEMEATPPPLSTKAGPKPNSSYKKPTEATGWNDTMMLDLRSDIKKEAKANGGGPNVDEGHTQSKASGDAPKADGGHPQPKKTSAGGGEPGQNEQLDQAQALASALAKLPGAGLVAESVATSMGLPPGSGAVMLEQLSNPGAQKGMRVSVDALVDDERFEQAKALASSLAKLPGAGMVADSVATSMGLPPGTGAMILDQMANPEKMSTPQQQMGIPSMAGSMAQSRLSEMSDSTKSPSANASSDMAMNALPGVGTVNTITAPLEHLSMHMDLMTKSMGM